MNQSKLIVIDTHTMPWEERFNEKIGRSLFRKELYTDPETGALVRLVRYPAGVINPSHTHPCGHGMYVLEGKLVTHDGTFDPGTFVWFPEGEVMEHGARKLKDFKGYTVDLRLQEFREMAYGKRPQFIPFASLEGRALLAKLHEEVTR